jgi:hypothetical protein
LPPEVARAHAALLVGQYDSSQREATNYVSLLNLVLQADVTTDIADRILASPIVGSNGQPKRFEEVAPYVWNEVGGESRLAAKVSDGRVVLWAADHDSPHQVYQPTPPWRDATWLLPLLVVSIAVTLAMGVAWPIGALVRRQHGVRLSLDNGTSRVYRWARALALAAGLVMSAWLATVSVMAATFFISSSLDPWIGTLHVLSAVVFPLAALATAWHAWVVWRTRTGLRSVWIKAWSGALVVACLALLYVAVVYHLIGTSLAS